MKGGVGRWFCFVGVESIVLLGLFGRGQHISNFTSYSYVSK
jgi:hypothetical protein